MALGGYSFLDKLSQAQARHLYEQGATFLLLNLPPKSIFGIDTNSWEIGDKFKGVKMIPSGVHFIFCQSIGREGCTGPVIGFFHVFKPKELLVKEWDIKAEIFSSKEFSEIDLNPIRTDLRLYEPCLAPYPYDNLKTWVSLTNHVTDLSLAKIGINGAISAFDIAEFSKGETKEGCIKFSHIPLPSISKGASPIDITRAHIDRSHILLDCLKNNYQDNCTSLFGEIQCSFLLFVYGHIYEGFEQWRRLVELLCSCDQALVTSSQLYSHFITILHFQLNTIPVEFLLTNDQSSKVITEQNIFLVPVLNNLFLNLKESSVCSELKDRADRFKSMLIHKFKWNFEVTEEDMPVIVNLGKL
ncbi:hypothetical protein LOD99_326 [Oopsacas minuta]|uniref:Protein AAR2 homolog n=1 Tax=Oopsacas minuta TaxID=111878 RepID=A0AAV7K8M0_9METZ|nr:hypothetical protein LOD99_326 [Oopsacas minuta]